MSSVRHVAYFALLVLAVLPGAASAQESTGASFLEGGGVRLGDSVVMHPRFELSTGYASNVFSQDDTDVLNTGSLVLRLGVGALFQTDSAPKGDAEAMDEAETARPAVAFRGDAFIFWNQYVTGGSTVTGQSDLGANLLAEVKINPLGQIVFGIREAFQRLVRPGQAAQDVDHDYNDLGANLLYRPGGGALTFSLAYNFVLDIFESSNISTANRITHKFTTYAKWQWLPKTDLSLQAALWVVDPLENTRPGSTPFRVTFGTSTLLTPTFGVVLRAGYGNSFYSTGANFSSYLALAELRYGPNSAMSFALGYSHDFADAYIGNFYVDHSLYLRYAMQLGGRLQLGAKAEVKLRSYEGLVDPPGIDFCGNAACENIRDDLVLRAELGAEYQIKTWLFASLSYALNDVTTDFFIRTTSGADSAGFVSHELFAKLAAKF